MREQSCGRAGDKYSDSRNHSVKGSEVGMEPGTFKKTEGSQW